MGAVAVLLATACGTEPSTTCDASRGETRVFVMTWAEVAGIVAPGGMVYGLDLDGRGATCEHSDEWISPPPFEAENVDNKFGALIDFFWSTPDTRDAYRDAIASGELLQALVIEGVEDETADSCVHVRVVPVRVVGAGAPAVDEWGDLIPDQRFELAPGFGGETELPFSSAKASIVDGWVTTSLSAGDFPLYVYDFVADAHLESAAVKFRISGGTQEGLLGGSLDIETVLAALEGCCRDVDTLLYTVSARGNLDMPSYRNLCGRMSAAFWFEGVPATLLDSTSGP